MTPMVLGSCLGFAGVTEAEIQVLMSHGAERWFQEGALLTSPQQPLDGALLILSGTVHAWLEVSGQPLPLAKLNSGEWLGAASASAVLPGMWASVAVTDVRAYHLPATGLDLLQRTEPVLAARVLRSLSHSVARQLAVLGGLKHQLAVLSQRHGAGLKASHLAALGLGQKVQVPKDLGLDAVSLRGR